LTRRWLLVVEDPLQEIDSEAAAESYFKGLIDDPTSKIRVVRVRRGGILADKVMEELPPVRHELMGRPRERA
jgi:hypothetical protein